MRVRGGGGLGDEEGEEAVKRVERDRVVVGLVVEVAGEGKRAECEKEDDGGRVRGGGESGTHDSSSSRANSARPAATRARMYSLNLLTRS